MSLTWDHALYVVVLAVFGAVLDYRSRRRQERNDRMTERVYETLNGGGLLGEMRQVREDFVNHEALDNDRHVENRDRLDRIEEALTGRRRG